MKKTKKTKSNSSKGCSPDIKNIHGMSAWENYWDNYFDQEENKPPKVKEKTNVNHTIRER